MLAKFSKFDTIFAELYARIYGDAFSSLASI